MTHLFFRLLKMSVSDMMVPLQLGFLHCPNPLYSPQCLQKGRIVDEFLVMVVHK